MGLRNQSGLRLSAAICIANATEEELEPNPMTAPVDVPFERREHARRTTWLPEVKIIGYPDHYVEYTQRHPKTHILRHS